MQHIWVRYCVPWGPIKQTIAWFASPIVTALATNLSVCIIDCLGFYFDVKYEINVFNFNSLSISVINHIHESDSIDQSEEFSSKLNSQ